MNTKKILTTLAISAVLLTGCGMQNKEAIISVNNDIITKDDFDSTMSSLTNGQVQDEQSPLYLVIKDRVVNELVVRKLLDQEIEKRNITVSKDEEEIALQKIIDKYGSKEILQKALKESGISNDKFKKDLVNELKIRKLINMLGSVNVSDAEIKKFYKENPTKFKIPEKVRASHILISANPKSIETFLRSEKETAQLTDEEIVQKVKTEMASQKAKAEKLLAQVKADSKNFEKYARENSEDFVSKQKGGDLGFFAYEDMVEPFAKAAFSLKPNKVSNLIQTDYGYHIIIVKDRTKASTISFEKSKEEIKQYLIVEKQVKLLESLITQLKNNAKIEFHNDIYKPSKIEKDIKKELKK